MNTLSAQQLATATDVSFSLFDVLPEAYVALDEQRVAVAVNASFLALTNRTRAETLGRSIIDVLPVASTWNSRTREQWLGSIFERLKPHHVVRSTEFRRDALVDGVGRFVAVNAFLLPLTASGQSLVLLRLDDVTDEINTREHLLRERAQFRSQADLRAHLIEDAQEEIRQEKNQLEDALSFARIGAWRLNMANGDITCTTQCKANIGLAPDVPLTESMLFNALIDPRDRPHVEAAMQAGLAQRTYFEAEYRTHWADGSQHWIMVRGHGRYDENGQATTLHGLTLDITERKESELRQAGVIETAQAARQLSDERVAAMDGFVSAVSHEIRSPLNAILSWSQLLRQANGERTAKAAAVIERNARQLSLMVDDLLDTGAIANGQLTVRHDPVDIGAIAAAAAEDLRPAIEAKGIAVDTRHIDSCLVFGDESRLRQVAYNLLSNALKFTHEGQITISVRTEANMAVLSVVDTGVGISDTLMPSIFGRFQQAVNAGSGRVGGLGLGLWLVKNITTLHGGCVAAQSDGAGHGSTFVIRVPLLTS